MLRGVETLLRRMETLLLNNLSINQSINQSSNQSINQPINKSIKQSIKQSINQPTNQPTNQSTNQSINQSIDQSINHTITHASSLRSGPRPATKAAITLALQSCLLDSNLSTHHLSSAQATVTDQATTPELAWTLIRYAWNYKDATAIKSQAWSGLHFSCATLLKIEWFGNMANQNVLLWHRLYT